MAIELDGVSVRYGDLDALTAIDLRVAAGERVALVGSSGAGKSTMLRVISGLVVPDSGAVRVFGVDIGPLRGRRLRAHRSRVGVVGQPPALALPLRVVHNVNSGRLGRWSTGAALWSLIRPIDRAEAVAVLDRVGLADRVDSRTDELSGGERQRVAVARVLRQHPELVLADEPTSSVDPRLGDDVMGVLCADPPAAPWTAVVSIHDPGLARRHATRIVGLRRGRIEFDRSPDAVSDGDMVDLYRPLS